jgi:hypothetical protein
MHTFAIALICFLVPDTYITQVIFLGLYCYLVFSVWLKRYVRLPLIAMGSYLVGQALWLPSRPELGWFAPKEVVTWALMFCAAWVIPPAAKLFGTPMMWVLVAGTWIGPLIYEGPVIYNTSLNAAMIIACFVFASPLSALAGVLTVLLKGTGASAGLMAIVLCFGLGMLPGILAVIGAVGYIAYYPTVVTSELLRFQFWELSAKYFVDNFSLAFGSGLGTFMLIGPTIQKGFYDKSLWFSAHNDWLQWTFETGLVGLALLLWLVYDCIKRLPINERLVTIALCVLGATYFPMDTPLFQLLIAVLVTQAQRVPKPLLAEEGFKPLKASSL